MTDRQDRDAKPGPVDGAAKTPPAPVDGTASVAAKSTATDDPSAESYSLESLVERSSSRPPPAGTDSRVQIPRDRVPALGAGQGAQAPLPMDRDPISAWGSPTLSSMRPPPPPSRAIPLAIVAGFGLLSAAVLAAVMIFKEPSEEEPRPAIVPVEPVLQAAETKPSQQARAAPVDRTPATAEVEPEAVEAEQPVEPEEKDETAREPAKRQDLAPLTATPDKIRAAVVIRPADEEPAGTRPENEDRASPGPVEGKRRAPARRTEGDRASPLPEQPSREQTLAALRKVEGPVKQCAKEQGGTAMILVKVAGKTGAVQSVSVDGVEGSVGLCIAREVYRAKFPRFSQPVFTVRYPLAL
jgi:ribonuclease E